MPKKTIVLILPPFVFNGEVPSSNGSEIPYRKRFPGFSTTCIDREVIVTEFEGMGNLKLDEIFTPDYVKELGEKGIRVVI